VTCRKEAKGGNIRLKTKRDEDSECCDELNGDKICRHRFERTQYV